MDQTLSSAAAQSQSRQKVTDIVVVTAMGLVAVAVSIAVSVHFGLPTSRAAIAGVLIFALLVGAHFLLMPRATNAEEITELEDEELWNALKEQRRNAPDAKRMAMATRVEVEEPTPDVGQSQNAAPAAPAPHSAAAEASDAPSLAPTVAHVPRRKPRIVTQAAPQDQAVPAEHHAPVQPQASEQDSYWSYRPNSSDALAGEGDVVTAPHDATTPVLPEAPAFSDAAAPHGNSQISTSQNPDNRSPSLDAGATPTQDVAAEGQSQPIRESDVELVQSMIKKLAHEVNAAEVLEQTAPLVEPYVDEPVEAARGATAMGQNREARAPQAHDDAPPPAPTATQQPRELPPQLPEHATPVAADAPQIIAQSTPPEQPNQPLPPSSPAAVDLVSESVGALRSTAEVMREADEAAPVDAPQVDQPVRPAMRPEAGQVADAISAALDAGHVGVLLEPIVTLNDMRPDHYEVRLQMTAPTGADLDNASVERELQATGVLGEVDRQRFIKTLSVGELLHERGKAGSLLTRIYRESLLDRDFCFAVATSGVANEALARHMVLTLTQETVRQLTASEWQTLSEFHELGYRFGVSHVHDLDMDFAQLSAAGFTFVKLSADTFLENLLNADGAITPKELSRYLTQSGFTLIIEGLDDAARAAEALDMGAGLGQGPITGGPRLMKAEAVAGDSHAVA